MAILHTTVCLNICIRLLFLGNTLFFVVKNAIHQNVQMREVCVCIQLHQKASFVSWCCFSGNCKKSELKKPFEVLTVLKEDSSSILTTFFAHLCKNAFKINGWYFYMQHSNYFSKKFETFQTLSASKGLRVMIHRLGT